MVIVITHMKLDWLCDDKESDSGTAIVELEWSAIVISDVRLKCRAVSISYVRLEWSAIAIRYVRLGWSAV